MIVYHGSNHVIEVPEFNGSKKTNDYGYGFYTTESLELAKEWACADNRDGFANSYYRMPVLPGDSSINWVWERFLFLMHNSYMAVISILFYKAKYLYNIYCVIRHI